MDNDVITKYIKFVNSYLTQFFKIVLSDKYSASLVSPFVSKYIEFRYYNNGIIKQEKNIVNKVGKEISKVARELISENEKKIDDIKNISALFGYIFYIDDCIEYESVDELLDILFNDELIKLEYTKELKKELVTFIKDFVDKKKKYLKQFDNDEFQLIYNKLKRNYFAVDILQNCNITKLYSEYAINKAFNTGILVEQKLYLLYILLSAKILEELINQQYNTNYIVEFPIKVLNKDKKIKRYYKVLENELLKNKINLLFTYTDYINNREAIDKLIHDGFSIAIRLDENFKMDIESLILFNCILVSKDELYYDSLIDLEDSISCEIISL